MNFMKFKGKHSEVYVESGRAIKIFKPEFRYNFWKEVRYLTILKKKNFVPKIFNFNPDELKIEMEFVDGTMIRDFVREREFNEVVNEMYDFKFLPYPQIVLERKIQELNELLKSSKGIEKKEVKRLVKEAKKVFNKGLYGESYELLKEALEELKKAQLIVKIPKKVKINKEFNIILSYKNVLYDNVENLVIDITDFEKYFDVEQKIVEFPPVRRV